MTGTTSVARSGDQRIDGLLFGTKWNASVISYSDPDSPSDYPSGYTYDLDGDGRGVLSDSFSHFSASQLRVVHATLDTTLYTQLAGGVGFSVEGFTNLGLNYAGAGSGSGTIRVANSYDWSTAYAFYPSGSAYGGDAFFGPSGDLPTTGNYDYHTIIHELGHALGLKHGQDTTGFGALPTAYDSLEFSVMTYRTFVGDDTSGYNYDSWSAPQTFMMLDIAALQHLYGADFTTNATNTTYSWNSLTGQALVNGAVALSPGGDKIFETIWDGGGTDTYNLSNYATNLTIDLTPGGSSVFSSVQLAYLGGGPNGGYARGNVFNALQYHGDTRSLIENAIGGSGNDKILGNAANNVLTGNAGNDTLTGGAGSDSLNGNAGADTMNGDGGNDFFYVDNALDKANEATAGAAGGFDIVYSSVSYTLGANVESLRMIPGSGAVNGTGNGLDNELWGTTGANTLRGLAGADKFDSGSGADVLVGGLGNDQFKFTLPATSDQASRDRVIAGDGAIAFESAGAVLGDRFDLSGMDGNTSIAGQQHLVFGTTTGVGHIWAVTSGSDTLIRGNVDADAAVEFEVAIADGAVSHTAYTAADFIL